MNDKAGQDGLVPTALLIGEYPRMKMPDNLGRRPKTDERGDSALAMRCEMKDHGGKMRITRDFFHNVPGPTDAVYETGDKVLVLRYKGHTSKNGEYLGPFK